MSDVWLHALIRRELRRGEPPRPTGPLNPDVVDELRRVERKPSPSMLCEVCDRPPLWSVNHGRGWSVRYLPHRERITMTPIAEFRSSDFVGYTVFTCGGEICVWRAAHHGYPGMRTR